MEAKDTVMSQEKLHKDYFNDVMPWPAIPARYIAEPQKIERNMPKSCLNR